MKLQLELNIEQLNETLGLYEYTLKGEAKTSHSSTVTVEVEAVTMRNAILSGEINKNEFLTVIEVFPEEVKEV